MKELQPTQKSAIFLLPIVILLVMQNSCIPKTKADLGLFDNSIDIGNPKLKGSSIYNSENDTYTITGAGDNMWFDNDEFHFTSKKIEGDFILKARVKFIGEGVNAHRKFGIMVRDELNETSPHINAVVHGDGLTSLQYRSKEGNNTEEKKAAITSPNIIQLERKGNNFIFSSAVEGNTFTRVNVENLNLKSIANVGLFVCSHEVEVLEIAVFDNVRLIFPAPDSLVPYRDYIGSHIELMDVKSGNRKIIYSSPMSLQAPNWRPNTNEVVYNSEGKLFSLNTESLNLKEIDTGFAQSNNNDHVLSFDGSIQGISDHTEHETHQSLIYILPSEGGIPEKATAEAPSYLHGFSPDQKYIIYTAGRGNFEHLDIYKMNLITNEEVQLTNVPGLDDGSEYSPDGKYIYFNSTRTGTMQIWRMNPDGSEQVQLTFDEYNDWFPHVSPDGKWLVFISYEANIPADDHPFYKQVYLRQMPVNGGEPKVIAYVYGGQGTMNVPSWSPDSKKIAFVSNTILE